jgi:GH25 family lysozyme M1 (1,4-beta-N-acetylmuramidase)
VATTAAFSVLMLSATGAVAVDTNPTVPQDIAPAVPPNYPITGVDVSNHQGTIAWNAVAASGQRFAYAKATEGVHFVDPYFAANYLNAKANNLFIGAYHYARPDRSTGRAQADYFLDRAQYRNDGRTLPPMLDIEWPWEGSGSAYPCYGLSPGQMVSWIRDFVERIRARTGQRTMIYTNVNWWNPCTASNSSFGGEPLFVARYAATPGTLPAGWNRFTLWQFTSSATVPGIAGHVDQDVFNGSLSDLARTAGRQWPRMLGDFNGDGRGEAGVWRPGDGTWWVAYSGGGWLSGLQWGLPGDVPLVGDYNGDHRDDYTVWRPSSATWWVKYSAGGGNVSNMQWGLPTDIPLAGDINGDGRDDFVTWRPSDGTWWVRYTGGGDTMVQWGLPGDIPLLGDFNRDQRDDFIIWRPSNGTWWVRYAGVEGFVPNIQWGLPGDIPLAGDLNGDGVDDFTVWRPSDGTWWVRYAGPGGAFASWGVPGDYPLLGDVGGTKADDFVIWRPESATWWVRFTDGSGYVSNFRWGESTDIPL